MKTVLLTILGLMSSVLLAAEPAKLYHSFDAEMESSIGVVPYEGDDLYLITFSGFGHVFDGKVMLYKKQWNGRDKRDGYFFQLLGNSRIHLRNDGKKTAIFGTTVSYSEAFLPNAAPVKMLYAGEADVLRARKVLSRYQEQQGLVKSKVEAKKLIAKAQDAFESACNQTVSLTIDWSGFQGENKNVPGMMYTYFDSLRKICAIDEDYLEAVNAITTIKVAAGSETADSNQAILDGSTLLIKLIKTSPNTVENSYEAIYDML